MHDHLPLLDQRVERALDHRIRPAQQEVLAPLDVASWPGAGAADVEGEGGPVPFAVAVEAAYEPTQVGVAWGPAWGTTWFRLSVDVPEHEPGQLELAVDLGWEHHSAGFQCEALVFDEGGRIVKALNPRNAWLPVPDGAGPLTYYVEAAANPLILGVPPFFPTAEGDSSTASTKPLYALRQADLVRRHAEVVGLTADLEVLHGIATQLPEDSTRRWRIAMALQDCLDALDTNDVVGTAASARESLQPCLRTPADHDAFSLTAVGHAHIDSAWLWPVRETRRKVARTVSNVVALLECDENLIFSLPAAQHVAWLKEDYPELFERLKAWVAKGKIVPVGAMWVEPDGVLPGGEAMCRQFLWGQRFFETEFGMRCRGMWLPDSFGYSGALPQIAAQAGLEWFLTQKLSWNQVDSFPHHSFEWEGIDGTRLFTHFPAVDTYNSELTGPELRHAETSFKDKGRAASSLVPFGYGDGGGGPTREMVARLDRLGDLAGSPKVHTGTPDEFFAAAKAEYVVPPVWVGELYLEKHRGTFTSQHGTKAGNRCNEHLLREAELWWSTAAARGLGEYPWDVLDDAWRTVLLNQFHDILPGSSIAWEHREAEAEHERVTQSLTELINDAHHLLAGEGDQLLAFNASPFSEDGAPALGAAVTRARPIPAEVLPTADGWRLANKHAVVLIGHDGGVRSLFDRVNNREVVPPGTIAGQLHLIRDLPNAWDAWDTDHFQRKQPQILGPAEDVGPDPDQPGTVRIRWRFGASEAVCRWSLDPDRAEVIIDLDVDWHEQDRMLKLALPLDVHTDHAQFETQFGHLTRPIHENTSWDAYRFEVNAHRWVRVAEPGYGVALANRTAYGYDLLRLPRDGGGTYTTLRASLLRGPQFPDPHADQGRHQFQFGLALGADTERAVEAGYRRNLPVREIEGAKAVEPLVRVTGALVESVKLAEDRSGDVVVRLYEHLGRRSEAKFSTSYAATVVACNLLEEPVADVDLFLRSEGRYAIAMRPFGIVTLRLTR